MEQLIIRPADQEDAEGIAAIYNPYILATAITFEEVTVSSGEIRQRIERLHALGYPWLVAEVDGRLAGYAYASRWRERPAYRYTAESTIYLSQESSGHGYGKKLYSTLLDELRAAGIHVVIGVITIPNPASVALHEKLGFKKVAHFSEVGFKFDCWLDVGYWQLIFKH
jgi:phosphinothricin acetyltransferase